MAKNKELWEENRGLALCKQQGSFGDLVVSKSTNAYNLKNLTLYECDLETVKLIWQVARHSLEKLSFAQYYQPKTKDL